MTNIKSRWFSAGLFSIGLVICNVYPTSIGFAQDNSQKIPDLAKPFPRWCPFFKLLPVLVELQITDSWCA